MDPVCRIEVDLGESRAVVAALVDEDVEVIRTRAPVAAGELLLASIPGISVGQGRALLDRFGSVASIAAADEDELLAVPGVGQMRAAAIRRALLS
jgi:DNA integrity scanning protein DisA with diadenylate cyclase activity